MHLFRKAVAPLLILCVVSAGVVQAKNEHDYNFTEHVVAGPGEHDYNKAAEVS